MSKNAQVYGQTRRTRNMKSPVLPGLRLRHHVAGRNTDWDWKLEFVWTTV